MSATEDGKIGVVKIADEVIAECILQAVQKTKGIHGLSGGLTDTFAKSILGKDSPHKGIKLVQGEEGVTADLSVIVEYGVKIPAVAWELQSTVKKEIEHTTELRVLAVNIHVMGVAFAE